MNDRIQPTATSTAPELDVSDLRKIEAAEGHHMIGQYQESANEIAGIPPPQCYRPRVLHVACRAYWGLRQMPEAIALTERFIQAAPHDPFGYSLMANLLGYLGKSKEICELFRPVMQWFPKHATMHYLLACASAECGLWAEARHWLYRAICIQSFMKQVALGSPEFAPMKTEIEAMNPGN
jgi:hypothetical protein